MNGYRFTTLLSALLVLLSSGAVWGQPGAGKVIVILVGNTREERLGVAYDLNKVKQELHKIEHYTKKKPHVIELTGANCSIAAVKGQCEKLTVGPDDAVIFYYGGHGFTFADDKLKTNTSNLDAKLRYPALKLLSDDGKEEGLKLHDIYLLLSAKRPRLLVAIADCCDSWLEGETPHVADLPTDPTKPAKSNLKSLKPDENDSFLTFAKMFHRTDDRASIAANYHRLYFEEKGHYIISGSKLGQRSHGYAKTGALFTNRLLRGLQLMESNRPANGHPGAVGWKLLLMGVCTSPVYRDTEYKIVQHPQWDYAK